MKKIFITTLSLLLLASPVYASTLWDYYGGNLPSIAERAPKYNEFFDDEYEGTAIQNQNFLEKLTGGQTDSFILGARLPDGVATFQTSLQSAITSVATSMTLTQNSVRGGSTLSGYQCFTVDEGSSIAEYICGTVSGTAVSSLTRGVDPLTGTTTNSSLQFAHRRGAEVKVTDFPIIQIVKNQLNGRESIPAKLFYTQDFTFSSSTELVPKKYVDDIAIAGSPDANDTTKGIVELATNSEAGAGTSLGSTGARLALGANLATSSCQVVQGSVLISSSTTGKLDKGCFDQTANYVLTGSNSLASTTLTATTSISASSVTNGSLKLNGVDYAFPSSRGSASTVLTENGSGTLSWSSPASPKYSYASTSSAQISAGTTYTSSSIGIPANTLTASSTIEVVTTFSCASGGSTANACTISLEDTSGNTYLSYSVTKHALNRTIGGTASFRLFSNNSTSAQRGVVDGIEYQTGGTLDMTHYSSANTTSIDWTVAKTFRLKLTAGSGAGNSSVLNPFTILVNP